jgi:hypothetical protein
MSFLSPERAALSYLYHSDEVAMHTARKNEASEYIKKNIRDLGELDENGNVIWLFDNPMTTDDAGQYLGFKLQRRVSEYVDEEKARTIIESHGLGPRCVRYIEVTEIDYDEMYAANQQGIISDDEIDSIISADETWALVKVKA